MIRSLKKALQPSANNVAVTFEAPSNYQVKVVPEKIPSIYNGEKTVIYGLLMEKSEQKGENMKCKATLTGDIIGKKFKFDIPFELTEGQSEKEDVSVIHQLAVKGMIQEWQDDEGPYEQKHKKEIIELSTDASVVSRYTAYIAVDVAQNKPVSGSMQGYELTAASETVVLTKSRLLSGGGGRGHRAVNFGKKFKPAAPRNMVAPRSMIVTDSCTKGSGMMMMRNRSAPKKIVMALTSHSVTLGEGVDELLDESSDEDDEEWGACKVMRKDASSPKQTGSSFIVSLQQANGSWLLNDQLAGVVSKSVEELKSCCPVSCDDTVMANIWATLVVIELLKKKYPSMLDELELVIMKAEQWLHKQVLPSGVNLANMKEGAIKIV